MTGRRTPSEIHIVGDIGVINLNGRIANGRQAIIDIADIPLVQGYAWFLDSSDAKRFYVGSRVGGRADRNPSPISVGLGPLATRAALSA